MILVIADDLTGAAELGGIGIKHGLDTVITTSITCLHVPADLLIVATDTRSMTRKDAESVMHTVGEALQQVQPSLVYKKIDSVLRGHVLAEIRVLQKKLGKQRTLIVSANPTLGRTVVNGHYLLHGEPLHASNFSQDPEFPVTSSRVKDMLSAGEAEVQVLSHNQDIPARGVVVGEVKHIDDLAGWSQQIDGATLAVGAAEFFSSLLKHLKLPVSATSAQVLTPQSPCLAVWGSSFYKSRAFVRQLQREGFPVCYLPEAALTDKNAYHQWTGEMISHLQQTGRAGMAVSQSMEGNLLNAQTIRSVMANASAEIREQVKVKELLIEGGSTAAAVIRRLGIETLQPVVELAPGVIRMKVQGKDPLFLTLKPGSYTWPAWVF